MRNIYKLKKRRFSIFLIMIFSHFSLNSYAINNRKTYELSPDIKKINKKKINGSKIYLSEKSNDLIKLTIEDRDKLDNFERKILKINNSYDFDDQKKQIFPRNNYPSKSEKDSLKVGIENKKLSNKDENNINKKNKKIIIQKENFEKSVLNKLPLPTKSKISTSQFEVPSRGYVTLKGPKITLNLNKADTIETLKTLGKLANYGIVIIEDSNSVGKTSENNLQITANFDDENISDVFNSILLSSNLEAVLQNNIIFIGKNILNKSIKPKVSKTYRLNQVNAASVADYLSTLGANISKVMLMSGSINGTEVGDEYVNKKEFKDEIKNPYGLEGGPLFGLIGTADLRLQTITLIGTKDLIKTAEKYIKSLDIRHRQVALTIKIIDVSLTKTDLKENVFELKAGDTEVISNSGLSVATANFLFAPDENKDGNIRNIFSGGLSDNQFFNWLEAKITNENAKVLASPTLILGENSNMLSSGAAAVDDSLSAATIGRPFKNEGFIKVGETVITGFEKTTTEGVLTCTAKEGTAGITFGAKVDKIDDNGFVTFALSPAISSVTKTVEISGCGIQNTLSVRKLDTGSIRVKNGDTLVLTGVLKDEDNKSISKVPILGDLPLLGSLFRSESAQKRKSELIILVTPRILKDK